MAANSISKPAAHSENFADKLMPYLKRWYLFLITFVICMGAVWLYIDFAIPQYKITSTLLIPDDKKGDGILKATAFSDLNMFMETKTVDNEMEILRSRDLIYTALKKLNLDVAYFDIQGLKTRELYAEDVPFKITIKTLGKLAYRKQLKLKGLSAGTFRLEDGELSWIYRYGQQIKHKDYSFIVDKGPAFSNADRLTQIQFKNLHQQAASYSATKLNVNPVVKESNTLILSLLDPVPARGVDILTTIITTYNIENVQKKNVTAINTILFIDKRLKSMEQDLSTAEGGIEAFKQQNGTVDASSDAQLNLTKSTEYNQLLDASNVQLGIIRSLEKYLSSSSNQFSVVPSTMGLKDPVLNTLISRFNDLQLERNRMLNSANLSNPLVQNLSEQIASLRVNIKENLANIKNGVVIENNNLKSNYQHYDSRVRSVPALERGLLQRSREQSVKTTLYQYLLQKREETALSLSATIPTSQLVDKPAYDSTPEYPKQSLLYLCGSIVGLLLPALFIYVREQFNVKVKDSSSLNYISGVKILGELSHNEVKSPIAIERGGNSVISELFRYIRTNLGAVNPDSPHKVMLVTSCMKGEGKTFFSINLGLTLAMLNKKVLILEFDLRKPDLLQKLGIEQQRGITDFLQGYTDELNDCIQPYDNAENLYVLGCGSLPKDPAELLLDERMDMLFEWAKDRFDYLIIDTSPVGAVADAFSLAQYADQSIYLVRYNYTSTHQLDILRDIYDNEKFKNLMVVFNDAKKENRPAYAYGGYGYAAEKSRK
ncbi:polysaccharide biosynthesis tyrosine autokinase [Mucilaginibacter sabulilitoris]|uniref:non-specific protein-tyrosine kinase n=1 Tax=Mucilaginibacter sabulilitoris TaxID=1173583 RepID=A0ABZ0TVW7_9SPHI|nr:polysaccharide biosynthesis tyrosine autokinase [Mucilaginibacter sabulilitoris]WPU95290.1 polysaccharide biosynthesis tyrosine autokinase [Mucilaginibacter sabulilitoris]